MKNLIVIVLSMVVWQVTAQNSVIRESLTIESKILKKKVNYSIYLPAGYQENSRSYPVLYLLHGYTDNETGWTSFGEVQSIADATIASGEATPMIIAMPDAGVDWYVNSYDGKTLYEDFFIKEFITHIESTFRARGKSEFRAVAGLSMGGHGTLVYALKHPDKFAAAAPLSAAVWTKEEIIKTPVDQWNNYFGFIYGPDLEGEARITSHVRQNNGLFMVEDGDTEKIKKVKFFIDCGDDDFLIKGNMALHAAMIDKKIPHEFRVRDGAHTWDYWRTSLPEVLRFVSASFHR